MKSWEMKMVDHEGDPCLYLVVHTRLDGSQNIAYEGWLPFWPRIICAIGNILSFGIRVERDAKTGAPVCDGGTLWGLIMSAISVAFLWLTPGFILAYVLHWLGVF